MATGLHQIRGATGTGAAAVAQYIVLVATSLDSNSEASELSENQTSPTGYWISTACLKAL